MTIPDELRRSTPRPVALSTQGHKAILGRGGRFVFVIAMALVLTLQVKQPAGGKGLSISTQATRQSTYWEWRAVAGLVCAGLIGFVSLQRQRNLLMYGRPASATVTAVTTPWWYLFRGGRRHARLRRLECEYTLLNGRTLRTNVATRDPKVAAGAEVILLYNPDEPEKALLYPPPLLRIPAPR